ncbi:MAG: porphobilinogen synthase [Bacteroidota bacterium]|jgi:porphobilinogen synthase
MYLQRRNRILRQSHSIRSLVAENTLSVNDFIVPLFLLEGEGIKEEISSMPNYYRMSLDFLAQELEEIQALGLKSVILFVKAPDELKDNLGTEAINPDGLMPRAIRFIKEKAPDLIIFTDVALDPYSSYGHDGIVKNQEIVNDESVEVLAKMAVMHAEAGTDFVAPSDMMDGRIGAIREALEKAGHTKTGILSYSAKYASCFYGPFRDALDSAPGFGDKQTYQMSYANSREALKETLMDIEEGADIVLIKPALSYLDIIKLIKDNTNIPVCAYQVSGEYAQIKAAARMGWMDEEKAMFETLTSIKRAGADIIISYFAKDVARKIQGK